MLKISSKKWVFFLISKLKVSIIAIKSIVLLIQQNIKPRLKMNKTSFQELYDRTIKFYDFHYHLHKSTFKGLASVMKIYSECQKSYADKLIDISKNFTSYVPDLSQQMPAVKNSINDFVQSVSTTSQLHFNYSQRLEQISTSLLQEYNSYKKLKQRHMKILKDQQGQSLQRARQSRFRNKIQSSICKTLYEHLDKFVQEEFSRTQKLKEQILIYFALTKKIQQKQLQMVTKYKGKVSQEEIQIKINQIDSISQNLITHYNSYLQIGQTSPGVERLSAKKYQRMQSVQIIRQSLRQSTILREKINNIDGFKSKIKQNLKRFQKMPQKLKQFNMLASDKNNLIGLFDKKVIKKYITFSNLLQNQTIKKISFDMLNSYFIKNKQSQIKLILNTIKGNLKIRSQSLSQHCKNLQDFNNFQFLKKSQMLIDNIKLKQNKDYLFHLKFILIINELYYLSNQQFKQVNSISQQTLIQFIRNNESFEKIKQSLKHNNKLHLIISSVLTKNLLSSLILIGQDQPLLIDQYMEYLQLILKFSVQFLGLSQNLVKILFLDLIQNAIRSTKSKFIEEIYILVENIASKNVNSKIKNKNQPSQIEIKFQQIYIASIILNVTQGIVSFYKLGTPLINFFSILFCIENLSLDKFSAVQYFHKSIKRAGYTYIFWVDQDKKIIEPAIWQGQMRLKNLVQTLEMLEYKTLEQTHLIPTSSEMANILGVDESVILKKMKEELLEALGDIIEQNMDLLVYEQGIDKQGYVLKLGVNLVQLDIPGFKKVEFQRKFLKVLDQYLTNTQVQYNNLLDHSRKTQLWIMQQNSLATQNCIDFCSLLYKPFQFLLSTLKQLTQQNKTQFTQEFSQFIKNKLNYILKQQICKYINFLNDSLRQFCWQQPQIYYKLKRGQALMKINNDENVKIKLSFKEVVRRLYNLNFLKDQLQQIIHDFLEQEIYQDLGQSIFNLSNLSKATGKYKQYKQILTNLKDIVETISSVEQKLIYKISDITVYHFMKRLFYNIYFQEQKSTFEQFFSTKDDYKLSTFTFVNYQKEFQQIFNMIQKNIPSQIAQKYYWRLISTFFKALKYQILNNTKFKLPKLKQQIVRYLDQDTTFICTLLKQKYINPQIIEEQLQKPLKQLFSSLLATTKDLIQKFEAQSLNKNNNQCKYILIILYLRINDQKAQQFFKKFKTITFKPSS